MTVKCRQMNYSRPIWTGTPVGTGTRTERENSSFFCWRRAYNAMHNRGWFVSSATLFSCFSLLTPFNSFSYALSHSFDSLLGSCFPFRLRCVVNVDVVVELPLITAVVPFRNTSHLLLIKRKSSYTRYGRLTTTPCQPSLTQSFPLTVLYFTLIGETIKLIYCVIF